MSKKTDRIYVGSGVEKFDGDLVEISVNLTKLGKDASSFMFEYNNEKFIKLKVSKNRDGANEYGKTHFVEVNTYQPEAKKVVAQAEDDLPF
tara:strand:+ start:999 stop:1271 length:273 start_codon:yes stop_codon:yes gene_type:complete